MIYDLPKEERANLIILIRQTMCHEVSEKSYQHTCSYFAHGDTYIRKAAYIAIGRIYQAQEDDRAAIVAMLYQLLNDTDFKVRQTAINAAGEIGKKHFEVVRHFFDKGLFDDHYSPRNAVIGSIKKMGEVNPEPVLQWAKTYLHHENKEIRREICHGIELRGRKFPADILPLLKELQHDTTLRVKKTLVHVIGQIAYKKDCLPVVVEHLKTWENKVLVREGLAEIIDVHHRYRNFAAFSQDDARAYITQHFCSTQDCG